MLIWKRGGITDVYIIDINQIVKICIGRVGENNVTTIIFDYSNLKATFKPEDVTEVILCIQSNETASIGEYELELVKNMAIWRITKDFLTIPGITKGQLTFRAGDGLRKSNIFDIIILDCMN